MTALTYVHDSRNMCSLCYLPMSAERSRGYHIACSSRCCHAIAFSEAAIACRRSAYRTVYAAGRRTENSVAAIVIDIDVSDIHVACTADALTAEVTECTVGDRSTVRGAHWLYVSADYTLRRTAPCTAGVVPATVATTIVHINNRAGVIPCGCRIVTVNTPVPSIACPVNGTIEVVCRHIFIVLPAG